jgi:hypothetical protein
VAMKDQYIVAMKDQYTIKLHVCVDEYAFFVSNLFVCSLRAEKLLPITSCVFFPSKGISSVRARPFASLEIVEIDRASICVGGGSSGTPHFFT